MNDGFTDYLQAQAMQEQHQATAHQVAELQWELRHARDQSQQTSQAQKAALEGAQERVAKLKADYHQANEAAARVKESAHKAQGDAAQLTQDLAETKVCSHSCRLDDGVFRHVLPCKEFGQAVCIGISCLQWSSKPTFSVWFCVIYQSQECKSTNDWWADDGPHRG